MQWRPGWRRLQFINEHKYGSDVHHLQVLLRTVRHYPFFGYLGHGAEYHVSLDFAELDAQLNGDAAASHAMAVQFCQFGLAERIVQRFLNGQDLILAAGKRGVLFNLAAIERILPLFAVATDRVAVMDTPWTLAALAHTQDLVNLLAGISPVVAHACFSGQWVAVNTLQLPAALLDFTVGAIAVLADQPPQTGIAPA